MYLWLSLELWTRESPKEGGVRVLALTVKPAADKQYLLNLDVTPKCDNASCRVLLVVVGEARRPTPEPPPASISLTLRVPLLASH